MKLLYATSALYPSRLANRAQIYAMAESFAAVLGEQFALGIPARSELSATFRIVRIPGSLTSIALALRYALLIRREAYTHIYCREERLLAFTRIFSRLLGSSAAFYFEVHWMRRDFFFRYALTHADGLVAITEGLAEDIRNERIPQERVLVAPDAVDLSRYEQLPAKRALRERFSIAPDVRVVGYTGSFSKHHDWKGTDTLIATAEKAPATTLFWLIGGEPEEVQRLRSAHKRVRFEGFVAKEDIPSVQTACDVLVLPNKEGSVLSERYTSPLKLFEYLASGVPVVASNLPSIREVVSEREVVFFRPGDPDALLAALESVFKEDAVAQERAREAKELAQRYSWNLRAKAIIGFISS